MSSNAGTGVTDEVVAKFASLKSDRSSLKWCIFRLTDSSFKGHDVVEELELSKEDVKKDYAHNWTKEDELIAWATLVDRCEKATIKNRRGKEVPGPRYAVFDFEYEVGEGEGARKKLGLIDWCPDDMDIYWRTIHGASLIGLKTALGFGDSIQVKDSDEKLYTTVLEKVDKKADKSGYNMTVKPIEKDEWKTETTAAS